MKAKLFTLVVMLFMVASIQSQTILTENFDYTAGDSIGAHGWTGFSGSTNNIKVKAPGLTYTNYPLSNIGNCARISNNGLDNYKNTTGDSVTAGSFYVSFMVKVDSAKTGDYFMAMLPQSSTTNYFGRIFVKDSSGTLSFGIAKYSINATIPAVYGANGLAYGTTYLVIAKYKFNTGSTTDDEVSLYVFTSPNLPSTEPSTPYVGPITSTQTDVTSLGRIALRQGSAASAPSLDIDGIQVFKSWTNLVSVRNISTVADNFNLSQNYPNPFNPSTTINFSLAKAGFVTLKVYDITGKEVKSLVNSNMTAGKYEVNANLSSLNSGVYFYTINVTGDANYSATKKLMLVK